MCVKVAYVNFNNKRSYDDDNEHIVGVKWIVKLKPTNLLVSKDWNASFVAFQQCVIAACCYKLWLVVTDCEL